MNYFVSGYLQRAVNSCRADYTDRFIALVSQSNVRNAPIPTTHSPSFLPFQPYSVSIFVLFLSLLLFLSFSLSLPHRGILLSHKRPHGTVGFPDSVRYSAQQISLESNNYSPENIRELGFSVDAEKKLRFLTSFVNNSAYTWRGTSWGSEYSNTRVSSSRRGKVSTFYYIYVTRNDVMRAWRNYCATTSIRFLA